MHDSLLIFMIFVANFFEIKCPAYICQHTAYHFSGFHHNKNSNYLFLLSFLCIGHWQVACCPKRARIDWHTFFFMVYISISFVQTQSGRAIPDHQEVSCQYLRPVNHSLKCSQACTFRAFPDWHIVYLYGWQWPVDLHFHLVVEVFDASSLSNSMFIFWHSSVLIIQTYWMFITRQLRWTTSQHIVQR